MSLITTKPLAVPSLLFVAVLAVPLACGAARSGGTSQAGSTPAAAGTVARVGGTAIDRGALVERAQDQLEQVDLQKLQCEVSAAKSRHDVLRVNLEEMIRTELVEKAAAAAGVEIEAWRTAERDRRMAAVTDDEVNQLIARNRSLQQRSREQIEPQIRAYLAEEAMFDDLKAKTEVAYLLEAYRVPVEPGNGAAKGGPPNAPVTIVEFSDFQCPFCRQVNPSIDATLAKYGDKVRLVFRQFPLTNIHPEAFKAAEAALCARDQGKFWELHDKMFADQKKLAVADLKAAAQSLGLDETKFAQCLDSGQHTGEVRDDLRAGAVVGVSGTPALFVNGRPMSGAVSPEAIAQVVDEELAAGGR